jgi:hypothetical protein
MPGVVLLVKGNILAFARNHFSARAGGEYRHPEQSFVAHHVLLHTRRAGRCVAGFDSWQEIQVAGNLTMADGPAAPAYHVSAR